MGQRYVVSFDAVSVSAAQDLFELNVASTRVVIIHSLYLGQTSDMGDAAAEALKVQFITGHSSSGSGGSTPTPAAIQGGPSAASTCEANNTTIASSGTAVTKHQDVWNVQLPYQYRPTP